MVAPLDDDDDGDDGGDGDDARCRCHDDEDCENKPTTPVNINLQKGLWALALQPPLQCWHTRRWGMDFPAPRMVNIEGRVRSKHLQRETERV